MTLLKICQNILITGTLKKTLCKLREESSKYKIFYAQSTVYHTFIKANIKIIIEFQV